MIEIQELMATPGGALLIKNLQQHQEVALWDIVRKTNATEFKPDDARFAAGVHSGMGRLINILIDLRRAKA